MGLCVASIGFAGLRGADTLAMEASIDDVSNRPGTQGLFIVVLLHSAALIEVVPSTRCPATVRAFISRPSIALYRWTTFSTLLRLVKPDRRCHSRRPILMIERICRLRSCRAVTLSGLSTAPFCGGMITQGRRSGLCCSSASYTGS